MGADNQKLSPEERREHARYRSLVLERMPRSKTLRQCLFAFLIGGLICCIGQLTGDLGHVLFSVEEKNRGAFVSVVMIFIGALLTGLGVYDRLGAFAGAGSVVPITGFANSIVAPAMEHRREGLVMGVGAQLFTIAGPVLVYGVTASVALGLIAWIVTLCK